MTGGVGGTDPPRKGQGGQVGLLEALKTKWGALWPLAYTGHNTQGRGSMGEGESATKGWGVG